MVLDNESASQAWRPAPNAVHTPRMRTKIDRWTVTGTLILGTILFLTGALEDGHIDASDVRAAGLFAVFLAGLALFHRRAGQASRAKLDASDLLRTLVALVGTPSTRDARTGADQSSPR